ncbi:hypothetical protein AB0758_18870 [Tolypothrix bouteillei VB521301_2]
MRKGEGLGVRDDHNGDKGEELTVDAQLSICNDRFYAFLMQDST